jgi:nucleoid DNA-binding protein
VELIKVNTDDFVRAMSKLNSFSQSDNEMMLKTIISVFENAIANGEEIDIRGFGHLNYNKVKGGMHRFSKNSDAKFYPDSVKLTFSLSENFRRLAKEKNKSET